MLVVTGADGFIGSNLVKYLSEATNKKVLSVDYTNNNRNLHWCHPSDFLASDFYLKDAEVVFHNGASSSTTANDPFLVMHRNFDYSVELLKRCMEFKIRMIYASSASVYGDGPFAEFSPKNPKNLYALSKAMFDDYSSLFQSHMPQLVGLRYFNVYGKGEHRKGDMASVVYKFFHQHKKNGEIQLFEGSEHYYRDFVYIDDVVGITMHFYENDNSGIYNVGCGKERSFLDIANIFVERYGTKIKNIPMPNELYGKYQMFTASENEKLDSIYGSKRTSLEEGVNKYLDYLETQ